MLAEEWANAQKEEERYLSSRQERWREALARAAAAAEAGGEADDTDVEELMVRCLQGFQGVFSCSTDTATYTVGSRCSACSFLSGGVPHRFSLRASACNMSGV